MPLGLIEFFSAWMWLKIPTWRSRASGPDTAMAAKNSNRIVVDCRLDLGVNQTRFSEGLEIESGGVQTAPRNAPPGDFLHISHV
jgi:hypothetical protein